MEDLEKQREEWSRKSAGGGASEEGTAAQEVVALRKAQQILKADFEELQQLHQDLRAEHVQQTSALHDERLQLEKGLEQARLQLRQVTGPL